MAVAYLPIGAPVTAANMNAVFSDFDAKLSGALDGKSLLFWNGNVPFLGKKYFFLGASHLMVDHLFQNPSDRVPYDHSLYTYSANNAPVATLAPFHDATQRVLCVNPSLNLDDSLEVHTRLWSPDASPAVPYNLWARFAGSNQPQMVLPYHVAELIVEGLSSLEIPANYNKYNFFRVHNLGSAELSVTFPGGFVLVVPARGTKTVRRTSVMTGYEAGWNHFWRFHSGDPRTWKEYASGYYFSAITQGNNVTCPSLLLDLVKTLSSVPRGQSPKFIMDLNQAWDSSSHYCGTGNPFPFGFNPAGVSTKWLSNFLIHSGDILNLRQTTGAGNIYQFERRKITITDTSHGLNVFADAGLSVIENSNQQLVINKSTTGNVDDLASISTNLLTHFGNPCVNIPAGGLTIPNYTAHLQNFNYSILYPVYKADPLTTNYTFGGVSGTFSVDSLWCFTDEAFYSSHTPLMTAIPTHSTPFTLVDGAGKLFDRLGGKKPDGTKDTTYCTYLNRKFAFNGFGLFVAWERNVSLGLDPSAGYDNGGTGETSFLPKIYRLENERLVGTTLVTPGYHQFSGFGWPELWSSDLSHVPNIEANYSRTRWVNWRSIYAYSGWYSSPEWAYTEENPTLQYTKLGAIPTEGDAGGQESGIKLLRPYNRRSIFPFLSAFLNKSIIRSTGASGVITRDFTKEVDLIENGVTPDDWNLGWYNSRADWLSADGAGFCLVPSTGYEGIFTRCPLTATSYNNLASAVNCISKVRCLHFFNVFPFIENYSDLFTSSGLYGSNIRPRNQFSRALGGNQELAELLGIPIRTKLDLPASLAQLKTATKKQVKVDFWTKNTNVNIRPDVRMVDWGDSYFNYDTYQWVTFYHHCGFGLYDVRTEVRLEFSAPEDMMIPRTQTPMPLWGDGVQQQLFGTTSANAPEPDDYLWLTIQDVKATAEGLGFKFVYRDSVVPLKLMTYVAPLSILFAPVSPAITRTDVEYKSSIHTDLTWHTDPWWGWDGDGYAQGDVNHPDIAYSFTVSPDPALYWLQSPDDSTYLLSGVDVKSPDPSFVDVNLVTFVQDAAGDWVTDPNYRLRDYNPPDVFTQQLGAWWLEKVFPDEAIRRNWSLRPELEANKDSSLLLFRDQSTRSAITTAVLTSAPWLDFGAYWSRQSLANAQAKLASGIGVIPAAYHAATPAASTQACSAGDTAIVEQHPCDTVTFLCNDTI